MTVNNNHISFLLLFSVSSEICLCLWETFIGSRSMNFTKFLHNIRFPPMLLQLLALEQALAECVEMTGRLNTLLRKRHHREDLSGVKDETSFTIEAINTTISWGNRTTLITRGVTSWLVPRILIVIYLKI